jgi:hypothetical protein
LAGAGAERAVKANKKAAEELASKGRCGDYAMKIRKSTWWRRHYLNRQRGDGPEEVGWSVRMLRTRAAVCNDGGHMLYLPALITCPAI